PVEGVSWDDCVELCRKLGGLTGRRFRLPTEAEWEYACRAGTTTAYHTGDGLDALKRAGWCSYDGTWGSAGETKPVGLFEANAWGLSDRHGNVWAWCGDWFSAYPIDHVADPEGELNGTARVLRGGSWFALPGNCRSAFRSSRGPGYRHHFIGCRLRLGRN